VNRDRIERSWSKLVDEQLGLWAGNRDHPKPVAHRRARQQEIEPPK